MFLSAGLIAESVGHDRIAGLGGAGRAMPVTFLALGLGGLSLMGLPPSGGFAAKPLRRRFASRRALYKRRSVFATRSDRPILAPWRPDLS
jgi:NADH:ubiquinone oxidoreductase subunit 5 (subunit L)/multisubunit Na+/H+ antiporter MnhA subunit